MADHRTPYGHCSVHAWYRDYCPDCRERTTEKLDAEYEVARNKRAIDATIARVVARMNWLAEQDEQTRAALREECKIRAHIPTGERVMINPPLDICYRCGAEYRDEYSALKEAVQHAVKSLPLLLDRVARKDKPV